MGIKVILTPNHYLSVFYKNASAHDKIENAIMFTVNKIKLLGDNTGYSQVLDKDVQILQLAMARLCLEMP